MRKSPSDSAAFPRRRRRIRRCGLVSRFGKGASRVDSTGSDANPAQVVQVSVRGTFSPLARAPLSRRLRSPCAGVLCFRGRHDGDVRVPRVRQTTSFLAPPGCTADEEAASCRWVRRSSVRPRFISGPDQRTSPSRKGGWSYSCFEARLKLVRVHRFCLVRNSRMRPG